MHYIPDYETLARGIGCFSAATLSQSRRDLSSVSSRQSELDLGLKASSLCKRRDKITECRVERRLNVNHGRDAALERLSESRREFIWPLHPDSNTSHGPGHGCMVEVGKFSGKRPA